MWEKKEILGLLYEKYGENQFYFEKFLFLYIIGKKYLSNIEICKKIFSGL